MQAGLDLGGMAGVVELQEMVHDLLGDREADGVAGCPCGLVIPVPAGPNGAYRTSAATRRRSPEATMDYRDGGPPERAFGLTDLLDWFPGPVAILAEPIPGTIREVSTVATDRGPWSVDVSYQASRGHVLTIRTVRSAFP